MKGSPSDDRFLYDIRERVWRAVVRSTLLQLKVAKAYERKQRRIDAITRRERDRERQPIRKVVSLSDRIAARERRLGDA